MIDNKHACFFNNYVLDKLFGKKNNQTVSIISKSTYFVARFMKKEKKNILRTFNIYYRFYKQSGLLSFMLSNIIKVTAIIGTVILFVWLLNEFIINISDIPAYIIENFSTKIVLLFFLFSESVLGLIPPDLFILWISEFDNFYVMLTILGLLSYTGGLAAYALGVIIRRIPRIRNWVERLYSDHLEKMKKWGAVFIIIAALFPLPYAAVCTLAGTIKYPFPRLAYIGVFRIARFFIYAPIILGLT